MSVWWIINILIILLGMGLVIRAYYCQSTEDYDALLFFVVGVIVCIVGLISSLLKWLFFS